MKLNNKITLVVTVAIITVFVGTMPNNSDQEDVSERSYRQVSNDNDYTPYVNKSEEYEDQRYYY